MRVLALSFMLLFTSCAAFRTSSLINGEKGFKCNDKKIPVYVHYDIESQFNSKFRFKCDEDDKCFNDEGERVENIEELIKKVREDKKFEDLEISSCFDVKLTSSENYDYEIKGKLKANEKGSIILAVLSGLTLTIIPAKASFDYDLNYKLLDKNKKVLAEREFSYSSDVWYNLFLLPLTPFKNPSSVALEFDEDIWKQILYDIQANSLD